ncbi:MAG: HAMP domain-containing protein [Clostridia bacterium]|nr:HAMP domain-containing protein [Clostridia bacterium]
MKKISTKLNLAMLLVTAAVLAFVGAALIINIMLGYYRNFERTVTLVFENERFFNICRGFDGDISPLLEYLEASDSVLNQNSQRDYYILKDGNVIKSSRTGGILKMTSNLKQVLDGGYSTDRDLTSDALDFAFSLGDGYTVYVVDTRGELFSQLRDVSLLFLQALLFGVALAALLSFFISKRLTASIKKLEKGARDMSRGQFSEIEVKTHDEIGSLCTVFNEMGRQIQNDFDEFERAERAQREFVANVSHELKTPLTVIKSYSQTLRAMEVDRDTQKRFLATVDSEADRMAGIVGQLLYLSKLEQQSAVREEIDLFKLCGDVADTLKIESDKKGLTVYITGGGSIVSDRELIRTIIYNLLSNAVKYSLPGGEISVRVSGEEPPFITVHDNGQGIAPEDIEHIFERFYRADKSRGRDTGGTGLGLAIAKESARIIGAELTVKSRKGQFTEFTLKFSGENTQNK